MGALFAGVKGELELEDLLSPPAVPQSRIGRIRFVHHNVAQLLARGLANTEVSRITGMCMSRISILLADPTFKELVSFYAQQTVAANVKTVERLGQLSLLASEELQARLEENPEQVSTKDLTKILAVTADRSGNGPTSKVLSSHLHMTPADLMALKGGKGETVLLTTTDRGAVRSGPVGVPVGDSEIDKRPTEEGLGEEGAGVRDEGLQGDQAEISDADLSEAVDSLLGS